MLEACKERTSGTRLYTIYARGQLQVMRDTLAEMKRSGQSATEQIWQAIGNNNWLAREMNYVRDQSSASAAANARNAKAALDASIAASTSELRPYVSTARMTMLGTFMEGRRFQGQVEVINLGGIREREAR